jgi:uncharacterized membrane protein
MRDDRLEQIVGNLLRAGVAISAAVVLAGGFWYLALSGGKTADYSKFRPSVRDIHAVAHLPAPAAMILVGLLILIMTPIARVILSLIGFALERDWQYVTYTAIVLAILLYSIGTAVHL